MVSEYLHVRNHRCQRVTVIGIAGQCLHIGDELAALAVLEVVATLTLTPNS